MAVIIALTLPFIVTLIGGAADYSRMLEARTRLQTALDAAIMDAAAVPGKNPHAWVSEVRRRFLSRLRGEYERRLRRRMIDIDRIFLAHLGPVLHARVTARVRTPFLGLIGLSRIPVKVQASARMHLPTFRPFADQASDWRRKPARRARARDDYGRRWRRDREEWETYHQMTWKLRKELLD